MVSARRGGPEIVIVVDDEGPGIPPDKLESDLRALLLGSAPVRQHAWQELGSRPEHLARYRRRLRRTHRGDQPHGVRRCGARCRDDHPALKERREPGVVGTRFTVRLPAADAATAQGSAAACPTKLNSSTAPAWRSGGAPRCCAGHRARGKSDLALRFLFLARRGPAALDAAGSRRRRPGLPSAATAIAFLRRAREHPGPDGGERRRNRGRKASAEAELVLVVDLVDAGLVERLPPDRRAQRSLPASICPCCGLTPFEAPPP